MIHLHHVINVTKSLLLHSKFNGSGKRGKIKNQAAQGPRCGKYLSRCADRIFILGKMQAPLNFSYLEFMYLCNLATWANRKCQAYRMLPESFMTDVDRLKFKYIIVFTCKLVLFLLCPKNRARKCLCNLRTLKPRRINIPSFLDAYIVPHRLLPFQI